MIYQPPLLIQWFLCLEIHSVARGVPLWGRGHRWESLGNYPVFNVVIVIYHYVERIGELSLPPIFCITYTIMKYIIQVNQLIYINSH